MVGMADTESDYKAESDARSLRDAMAVNKDPKRLKKARAALKRMEEEAHKTLMETRAARGLKKAFPKDKESSHKEGC